MHVWRFALAAAVVGVLSAPAIWALGGTCPMGMQACSKGAWGPGGCYRPAYGRCDAGAIR